ncbi:MAG: hypothetical protein EPN97_02015 [Alphaproteobacteria bacterium]|nr:MAG: hypothetical protein EPN97_02015 [Alphaproteobacteria bacterium]
MNFGFTPPDPEKVLQALDNLKAAFQKAADADTGAAQPLFQTLSDKFNQVIDDGMNLAASDPNPNPNKIMMKLMPVMLELKKTLEKIQTLAATDSRVADAMQDLGESIQKEVTNIMGGIPGMGFPGAGGFGGPKNRPTFDQDDKPPVPPKPPIPKIQPRKTPKKPGNGDFEF